MKNRLSGFVCLVALCCAAPLAAQQPPETQAPPPQAAPPGGAQPSSDETPVLPGKLPLPPLPDTVDIRMPGERGVALGLGGWSPTAKVTILKGRGAATAYPGNLDLNSNQRFGENADISIAAGLHNILHITAETSKASGSTTAPSNLVLWNRFYYAGNYITTAYRLRHLKVSFDYLSWPYPVKTSGFRLRSLWQVQYVDAQTTFNAPRNSTVDANGNPLVNANGDLIKYDASGTKWYVIPAVGLGAQEYFTKKFSMEINGSGFVLPHHTNLWDADAAANIRIGPYEVRLGVRAFHFHTSPNQDFAMRAMLFGPFIGLRWHSDEAK